MSETYFCQYEKRRNKPFLSPDRLQTAFHLHDKMWRDSIEEKDAKKSTTTSTPGFQLKPLNAE